jgi:hypothetical protein
MTFRFDYFMLMIVLILFGSLSYAIILTAYNSQIPARLEPIKVCRDEFGRRKNVSFCDRPNDKKYGNEQSFWTAPY